MTAIEKPQAPPTEPPGQEQGGRRISRRQALMMGIGVGGVTAVGLVTGGFLLGRERRANVASPPQGRGGSVESDVPVSGEPIDLNTPEGTYHIDLTVQQNPELRQQIEDFMGTPDLLYMPEEYNDGIYPNLTIATPDRHQRLVVKLQPVGLQAGLNPDQLWAYDNEGKVPTWEEMVTKGTVNPDEWQDFGPNTKIFYEDDFAAGGGAIGGADDLGARAKGRTAIGTEHEAAFTVDAFNVPGLTVLPAADDRKGALLALTGELFEARVLGPVVPLERTG